MASSPKIAKQVAPDPDIRANNTPSESPSADNTSLITGSTRIAGASRSLGTTESASTQAPIEAPPSGHAGDSMTSVAPTRSSPLRKPSAAKTSLVDTGTRGLTITQGSFGRFSGNRLSPTPVMSQAREARHTG